MKSIFLGNQNNSFSLLFQSRDIDRSKEKAVREANLYFFIESGIVEVNGFTQIYDYLKLTNNLVI